MPDFVYEIKDKLLGVWDTILGYLPSNMEEYLPMAIPGLAVILSAVSLLGSAQAKTAASQLETDSMRYETGRAQIEEMFKAAEEADLPQDAIDNIGRMDLMLQYRQLASLSGENVFANMEKMAEVSSAAENAAEYDRDQMLYDSIRYFAGDYGGVLVKRSTEGTEADIRMAAYNDEAKMSAPKDSTVMNVLVQHLRRTIPSNVYGESDRTNTLVILSGTDVRKFSVIGRGSVMYTLFGKSEGSKVSRKYICTGIEPGTIDELNQNGESFLVSGDASHNYSLDNGTLENALEGTDQPVEGEQSSGSEPFPQTGASVKSVNEDGSVTFTDGTRVTSENVVIYQDGTIVDSDGTVYYPDGMIISPDGTISGGVVAGSESESGSSGSQDGQTGSESGQASSAESSPYGVGNYGSDGREFEGEPDSVFTRHVYAANGQEIINDKTHDLIFYVMNSQTGAVTITYWDLAGSDNANAALAATMY